MVGEQPQKTHLSPNLLRATGCRCFLAFRINAEAFQLSDKCPEAEHYETVMS